MLVSCCWIWLIEVEEENEDQIYIVNIIYLHVHIWQMLLYKDLQNSHVISLLCIPWESNPWPC